MPARLEIEGGVSLRGSVRASAAKNAALPALAAALLSAKPVRLTNVPDLVDVRTMIRLVETLGAAVRREGEEVVTRVERVASDVAPYELVSTMRASVLVLGPLVARHGSARVALPGGCAIGVRPIDQHLKGLARLGAEIAIESGYVVARASRLKGARIEMSSSSPRPTARPRRSTRRAAASSGASRPRAMRAGPARRGSRSRAFRSLTAPRTGSSRTASRRGP